MAGVQALRAQRDPRHATIVKIRRSFAHRNHHFQLDLFQRPCTGLALLETYVGTDDDPVDIPPWLTVADEVTGKEAYSMFTLSHCDRQTGEMDAAGGV